MLAPRHIFFCLLLLSSLNSLNSICIAR
jgi:hypothetical protein